PVTAVSGPSAHRPWASSATTGIPRRVARMPTSMRPSAPRAPSGSGTQISALHAPSDLIVHPVRAASSSASMCKSRRSMAKIVGLATKTGPVADPSTIRPAPGYRRRAMTEVVDVVVVGGGIGGAALATALARAGLGVTVLEATEEYSDRVRGESM